MHPCEPSVELTPEERLRRHATGAVIAQQFVAAPKQLDFIHIAYCSTIVILSHATEDRAVELSYGPEQEDFRAGLRDLLGSRSRIADVLQATESQTGFDAGLWRATADQLELPALLVPEPVGSGFGPRELVLVFEELGRVLIPGPYLASIALATAALLAAGAEPAGDLLRAMAQGDRLLTVGLLERNGRRPRPDGVEATALGAGHHRKVHGTKTFVLSADAATMILTPATAPEGLVLLAIPINQPGVGVIRAETLDPTRRLSRVEFTGALGHVVGHPETTWPAIERTVELGSLALAAEQVGCAQAALDMAVAYAKERIQFGRAIGSFQAIKHRLANVMTEVVQARATLYYGAWAATVSDPHERALATSLAVSCCGDAAFSAASANIQVHGAIAMTWEHPAHLYFRRAKSSQHLLGTPAFHRARIADLIDLGRPTAASESASGLDADHARVV